MIRVNLVKLSETQKEKWRLLWRHINEKHPDIKQLISHPDIKELRETFQTEVIVTLPDCCEVILRKQTAP